MGEGAVVLMGDVCGYGDEVVEVLFGSSLSEFVVLF